MNDKIFTKGMRTLVLMLAAIVLAAGPSFAAVNLMAVEGNWTPPEPDATPITMWGFATGMNCPGTLVNWDVGPQLTDADLDSAGDLTINLLNCLENDSVSIVIPGQPASFTPVRNDDGRITAFTTEAAPDGGTASYTWTGVKDGTYLYQSGSHPAKQVQMGLYGALTVGTYPGTSGDVTLLYSEIDPALHSTPAAATPLDYNPRHYLVNGSEGPVSLGLSEGVGDTNQPTVLRFLNAGLDFHVPTLNGGYMSLVAEDGNAYPFPKQQYSAKLAAGKTIDALWQPASDGEHVIYDRRGNGMVASLTVAAGVGAPVATADSYAVDEDNSLITIAGNTLLPGVLDNDDSGLTAILVSAPSSGILSPGLAANGSFTYTPNADFNGSDSFSYKGNNGTLDSNVANVTITVNPVNDAPVADPNGPYVTAVNVQITLDGTGSYDVDAGDTLTYAWDFGDNNTGIGATPDHTYTTTGTYTVSLMVNDGIEGSTPATTTVEVVDSVNTAPEAVDGSATVFRNSAATFIDMRPFVSDPDNNLCIDPAITPPLDNSISCAETTAVLPAAQIDVTTGTLSTRGGIVTVLDNGVNYTPKKNFRGTDTFDYNVTDAPGATSTPDATVRINVVK